MVFSQPSSPVLKARRQRRTLYSRLLYTISVAVSALWFIRYVLLDGPPQETLLRSLPNTTHTPTPTSLGTPIPGAQFAFANVSRLSHDANPLSLHAHHFSIVEASSLAAILPVTAATLLDLDSILHTLLHQTSSSPLTQIVLLTPRQHHSKTRLAVQHSISHEVEVDIEISIEPWLPSVSQGMAILEAARGLSTDWVLLLDEHGLKDISLSTQGNLLLSNRPSTAFPVGPRGIDYHLDGIACVSSSAAPQEVAYLVPPMVLPTSLIPSTLELPLGADPWASLGDYTSRSESKLSGGLVLGSSDDLALEWCRRYAPIGLDGAHLTVYSHPETAENARDVQNTGEDQPAGGGTFLFVTPANDLPYLSPVICGLIRRGHLATLVVQDVKLVPSVLGCDLPVGTITLDEKWLDDMSVHLPKGPDVIISTGQVGFPPSFQFQLSNLFARFPIATHVRLPREDMRYIDWMVSLDLEEWRNWHAPQIELSVITNDRPHSLRRLLRSLSGARYFGDMPNLRINVERSADDETLRMVDEYVWEHGNIFQHHRVIHGGLLTAVVESWYPKGNDSYGLILEDDVELSPLFYAYAKLSLLRYRYGKPENRSPNLFGISLYQQKNLELLPDGRHLFDARTLFTTAGLQHPHTPYLSQIPCSWGALYFPEHWREFHAYLTTRLSETVWPLRQTVVPGVRSNRWARSWKKYFIELVYLRGYVMLYPNYADFVSLSTNHLEVGSHVKDVPTDVYLRKKRLFNLPLMPLPLTDTMLGLSLPTTGLLELPNERLPDWDALPVLDLLGQIVDLNTISQRGTKQRDRLTGCEGPLSEAHDVQELLCTGRL
ncbi:hypothetical protein C8Q78DRAFT_963889 [Trametes maxima]|nr:hypothetical protein C8Q78DRAFT_963889 [Trametes maxima]